MGFRKKREWGLREKGEWDLGKRENEILRKGRMGFRKREKGV